MNFSHRCFLASKPGENLSDCEDSIFPEPESNESDAIHSFAVSDGTTTSFFSGLWSKILTAHFASDPKAVFDTEWSEWLKLAQQAWQIEVRTIASSTGVSMFTRNGVRERRPAAATFAAVLFEDPDTDNTIPWKAVVLGDSCLFLLRYNGHRSIQLTRSEQFSNWVSAAESYATPLPHLPTFHFSRPRGDEENLKEGDVAILATDALSRWLLLRAELELPVWGTLLALKSQSEFEKFVSDARSQKTAPLEPDDVALVVFQTGPAHEYISRAVFESNGRNPEGVGATQPAATGNPAVNSPIPDSATASITPLPTTEPAT